MTALTIETAIEAMKQAARNDFVTKPFRSSEPRVPSERPSERRELVTENVRLRAQVDRHQSRSLRSHAPLMKGIVELIERIANGRALFPLPARAVSMARSASRFIHESRDRQGQAVPGHELRRDPRGASMERA